MAGLFIELYLDEDVDILVAQLLRPRGFVVRTTCEAGNLGASDQQQLAYATAEGLALLTHNRTDFEALAAERFQLGEGHSDIIIATRHPVHKIARRLLLLLNAATADEMRDTVRYI